MDGTSVFTTLVFIANIKVVLRSYEWNFGMFFWGIGSIILYLLVFFALSEVRSSNLYGLFFKSWSTLNEWLLLIFFCVSFSVVEWGFAAIDEEIKNQR
jgi:hypothetical protein